jgi:hypothetical protein
VQAATRVIESTYCNRFINISRAVARGTRIASVPALSQVTCSASRCSEFAEQASLPLVAAQPQPVGGLGVLQAGRLFPILLTEL